MARRKSAGDADAKPKAVNVDPIERMNGGRIVSIYKIFETAIEESFKDLADARLLLCWDHAPARESGDGVARIYRVKKGSDIDQEKAEFDFAIIVSHVTWNKTLSEDQLKAAAHEALCCCGVVRDKHGRIREDDNGRKVYRQRRPPIQTFPENLRKYGAWRKELVKTTEALADFNDRQRPLLKEGDKAPASRFSEPAMGATNGTATNGANGHATNGHANGNGSAKAPKKKAAAK